MKMLFQSKSTKIVITLLLCIFTLFCFSTIAYSAFSSTMNLTGTARAKIEKDIRITDVSISDAKDTTPFYTDFNVNTISTKMRMLISDDTGPSIVYNVEITNYGDSEVGIFDINGFPDELSYKIINYNLKDKICDDANKCNLHATKTISIEIYSNVEGDYEFTLDFDFRTYHKVTYTGMNLDSSYPGEVIEGDNLNITFKESLKKVSILSNGTEISYYDKISIGQTITIENVSSEIEIKAKKVGAAKLVSGKINQVGSEICIKDECFYIISNDGTTVTMLAKYNLYAGNYCTGDAASTCTLYGEEATGLQDSTMIGYPPDGGYPRRGTLVFSTNAYWGTVANGTYVFDSNSQVYNYVENYKTYLKNQEVVLKDVRLIKKEELETLGCSISSNNCNDAPEWVYSTSYWTGTSYNESLIWYIFSDNYFNYSKYNNATRNGVRPVVELAISEISIPPVAEIISGDGDTIGSEICIKEECFYLISSDEDSVTMLTKHNITTATQPIQSINASPIAFSAKNYWYSSGSIKPEYGESFPAYVYDSNSKLYNYIENYKTYLESKGAVIEEARAATVKELDEIGCSSETENCDAAPSWVYSSSYWVGVASGGYYIWGVYTDGKFDNKQYSGVEECGIRPVISIPKVLLEYQYVDEIT